MKILSTFLLGALCFGCSGGDSKVEPSRSGAAAADSSKALASGEAKASASGVGSAVGSASGAAPSSPSAAKAAPPKPEDFGPNITKTAVESINASNGYEANPPNAAIDQRDTTAWSTTFYPEKVWLEVSLYPGTKVDGIEFSGGREGKNGKNEERWDVGAVMKKIRVTWDGGEGVMEFARATDKGVRKRLPIGLETRKLRLEILEIDPGSDSSNGRDFDLAELAIFGAMGALAAPDAAGYTGLCTAGNVGLRFKDGALYGGDTSPSPITNVVWQYYPTPVRVDDGLWHTTGIKFVEDKSDFIAIQQGLYSRAVGKGDDYRVSATGDVFEVKAKGADTVTPGKCGVTLTVPPKK